MSPPPTSPTTPRPHRRAVRQQLLGLLPVLGVGVVLLRVLGERFPLCTPDTEGPPSLPPLPWVDPAVRA